MVPHPSNNNGFVVHYRSIVLKICERKSSGSSNTAKTSSDVINKFEPSIKKARQPYLYTGTTTYLTPGPCQFHITQCFYLTRKVWRSNTNNNLIPN